jgi:hypothetical protein
MALEGVLFDFASISFGNPLVQTLGVTIVRSFAGWLENAVEDGKITWPEVKQLGQTYFRLIPQVLGLGAFFGPDAGMVGAFFTDWLVTKLANLKK